MSKKKSAVTEGVPKKRIPIINYEESTRTFIKTWSASLIPQAFLEQHIEKILLRSGDMLDNEDYKKYLDFLHYIRSLNIIPPKNPTDEYIKELTGRFIIQRGIDAIKNLRAKAVKRNKPLFTMKEGTSAIWKKINDTLTNTWANGRLFESPKVEWKYEGGKATLLLFIQALEPYLVHNVGQRWDYTFAEENFVLKNGGKTKKITAKAMYDVEKKLIANVKPDGVADKKIKKFKKELNQLLTSLLITSL